MDKTNFILYKDYQSHVELLSDEQAGKLFKAIFKYVDGRQEVELDGMTSMAFSFIKASLERDLVKYKKRVVASQENGKLGGRPSKPNPNQDKPSKPSGLSRHPRKGDSVNVSVNDTVSDNVNDSDNDSDIIKTTYLEFVKLTEIEYDKLINKLGLANTTDMIERLDNYIGQIGIKKANAKYKSHYHTILNWAKSDEKKNPKERITSKDVTDW